MRMCWQAGIILTQVQLHSRLCFHSNRRPVTGHHSAADAASHPPQRLLKKLCCSAFPLHYSSWPCPPLVLQHYPSIISAALHLSGVAEVCWSLSQRTQDKSREFILGRSPGQLQSHSHWIWVDRPDLKRPLNRPDTRDMNDPHHTKRCQRINH